MDALYYGGRARLAAKQLLDNTTLGERLQGDTVDDGELLSIYVPAELVASLSTGEFVLWGVLEALGGHPSANLYRLSADVDDPGAWCAWWALGVLLDKVTPMTPVDFDGLGDVVRRRS